VETQLEASHSTFLLYHWEVRKSLSMNRKVVACCLQDLNFVYCQGFTDIKSKVPVLVHLPVGSPAPVLVEGIRMVTGQGDSR